MPAPMEFSFNLGGKPGTAKPRDAEAPMRILLVGDFSARPVAERLPLAERPTHRVDVDSLDSVLARLAPRLTLEAGALAFATLDDFHPDALHARLPLFRALQEARSQPAGDLLGGLLGKPAAATAGGSVGSATGIGGFIDRVVAPHIVADTTAQQQGQRSAIDAATGDAMRAVLHAPEFQALESAWRGVQWLVGQLELDDRLQLHLFDVARDELLVDLAASGGRVAETGLHGALVDRERGVPGALGWNLICGLYRFGPSDLDIGLLAGLGMIAAQVGVPFVAAGDPALAGDDVAAKAGWQALRRSAVASSLALVSPDLLLRQPYGKGSDPISSFAFEEIAGQPRHEQFLWAAGSLAVALLVGRSFADQDFDPDDDRDIGDLPTVTVQIDGERRLLPCAECLLDTRTATAWLSAGLIPLQAHRGRNAVTVLRVQSIAEPATALAGLKALAS